MIPKPCEKKQHRPNPSTCIICMEYLLIYKVEADVDWAAGDSSQLIKPIVATTCGHLVHTECIIGWFNSQQEEGSNLKSCPYCRTKMEWCDLKRVFPVLSKKYIQRFFKGEKPLSGKRFRPTTSSCTICDNNTLDYYDELDSDGESRGSHKVLRSLVAARCGHYFHLTCLRKWFKVTQGRNPTLKPCPNPSCGREMHCDDTRRIYPVSSDEK